MRGLRYSQLIHGLRLANIKLDRKSLSDLAVLDSETFDKIFESVRRLSNKKRSVPPDTVPLSWIIVWPSTEIQPQPPMNSTADLFDRLAALETEGGRALREAPTAELAKRPESSFWEQKLGA